MLHDDVCGSPAAVGVSGRVFIVAANLVSQSGFRILTTSGTTLTDTLQWPADIAPFSVWPSPSGPIYVSGNGLWKYDQGNWTKELDLNFLNRVRGSARNNIFTAGSYFYLAHFNGSTWLQYRELERPNAVWRGLAVSENLVVAVGDVGEHVVVLRGNRR
jgi:hypothetical protein